MSAKPYPSKHHAEKRAVLERAQYKEFLVIPGVGPALAQDLYLLGMRNLEDLKNCDPVELYERLCTMTRMTVDPCVKYVFRCAHYYASTPEPEPEKLKWWNWMDS